MLELPIIELKEVYRQARNSPIIDLAWKLLEGNAQAIDGKTETSTNDDQGENSWQGSRPAT
jgi:hypothetical protein